MKLASLLAAAILLVSPEKLTAQQKRSTFLTWKKFGLLPSLSTSLPPSGLGGAVAGVVSNKLVIVGGTYFPEKMPWEGGKKKYESTGYVFTTGDHDSLILEKKFQFPTDIGYAAVCETNQGLIIAGGENQSGISRKAWMLVYNTDEGVVTVQSLPDLPYPISSASACFINGKVLLAGGETETEASNALLELDLNLLSKGWKPLASIPHAVSHAVLFSNTNSSKNVLILAGGRRKSPGKLTVFYDQVFQYDVNADTWSSGPSLPYPLAAGTGFTSKDGACFIFGGDKGKTYHKVEELMLLINASNNKTQIDSLNQQKTKVQSGHPGFSKEILLLNANAKKWVSIGAIPFETPVTTRAFWWGHKIILAPGEIRAGVRTADIYAATLHTPLP